MRLKAITRHGSMSSHFYSLIIVIYNYCAISSITYNKGSPPIKNLYESASFSRRQRILCTYTQELSGAVLCEQVEPSKYGLSALITCCHFCWWPVIEMSLISSMMFCSASVFKVTPYASSPLKSSSETSGKHVCLAYLLQGRLHQGENKL